VSKQGRLKCEFGPKIEAKTTPIFSEATSPEWIQSCGAELYEI